MDGDEAGLGLGWMDRRRPPWAAAAVWAGLTLGTTLGLAATPPVVKESVLQVPGADHHVVVDADHYPWSAVGKLYNSIGGACTAAVVARDKVLTAAHCLYAFRTRRFLRPESIHFLLGYARGDYRIHARVASFAIGPGYDPADETRTAAADWAVLTLAEPLPAAVRPIPVAQVLPVSGTPIEIGGFAQDRAYLMTADTECHLLGPSAGSIVLGHDCLIAHGDSGAPLLARAANGGLQAFAVTVGFWTVGGRQVSIAAPVTAVVLPTARAPVIRAFPAPPLFDGVHPTEARR